jgi:Na+-driven multidrug efflux pump
MAAYGAAMRVDGLTSMAIMNLGQAMSFFSGQNVGARQFDRVKKGYRSAYFIAAVFCVFTALLVRSYGGYLMLLFVKAEETAVIEMGTRFIRIMCYFYFIFAFMSISSGLLRGAGDVVYPMTTTVLSLIIRIVAAIYLIKTPLGALGLILAMPIGWGLAGLANNLRFATGKWKEKSAVVPSVLIEE